VLGKGWDLVEDCAHPERPARLVAAVSVVDASPVAVLRGLPIAAIRPLLVRAGEVVRLWQQTATVRIELKGIAEQSAASGEHVVVRMTRQTEDAGLAVQRIDGTVRGAGDVEMERQW
jgi:flagella basal body P-ring formation protein FlgA